MRDLPEIPMRPLPFLACASFLALAAGCEGPLPEQAPYDFSSDQATLLVFEFDGELVADRVGDAERLAENQLLYTIGHLNGDRSVGRFDKLELTDVQRTELEDGRTRVTYHAVMPVAWGSKVNLPETYELTLPLHVDRNDFEAFTEKYDRSCVDWGAHDVDAGSMWYYYRPHRSGCSLEEADVFTTTATVTVSPENTEGKYPEYHEVWKDDALTVVAIFGKYEDGATSGDAGINAYDRFVSTMRARLELHGLETVPAEVPSKPGVGTPDIEMRATLPDGRTVEVVTLLVDNVRTAGATFDARYESLSGGADMIFYNGHAGLGANVEALARKGAFEAGKYQIFFMNGCDTFAYVDGHLAEERAKLNPDDPTGSRYMDMITNVMPSYFHSMANASMALIDGLLAYESPQTYDTIFTKIDRSEVVVVTGEEDNVFTPGYTPGGSGWEGFAAADSLERGASVAYDLGELPAGAYAITTAGDDGGDVDLYVAEGRVATLEDYDHRPYLDGSNESVTLTLEAPARVHVMVHAYEWADADQSSFELTAAPLE